MVLVLLQGTFTPLAHAHAGRTPGAQADKKRDGSSRCERRVSVLPLIVDAAFCGLALPLYASKPKR